MPISHPPAARADAPITAGLSGATRNGCVALLEREQIIGICEQERVTRVRADGFRKTGLPDDALNLLLNRTGRSRSSVERYIFAGDEAVGSPELVRLDRHFAHACTSYLTSSFTSAVILICDHHAPGVSLWKGEGAEVTPVEWPWTGIGLSDLYSRFAELTNDGEIGDQRFDSAARLAPDQEEAWLDELFKTDGAALQLQPSWESRVENWIAANRSGRDITRLAPLASALQRQITRLLFVLLKMALSRQQTDCLCLGGDLFYHSSLNTFVRSSGLFSRVFIPIDPGEGGLAVGAALHNHRGPGDRSLSPFLGPAYGQDEIKAALDNCKVPYTLLTEYEVLETAATALRDGKLVGWYEGAMEWGRRALGARSILANPFAPYVLENLNRFLKHREPWRGYALSALKSAAPTHFEGPRESPFMECEFSVKDRKAFRPVLPSPAATIRLHLVDDDSPSDFRKLLTLFGEMTGIPCVVNTSFNGFHEPIVCSPRDAIRVFYSSGVDLLLLGRFLLTK